MISLKWLLLLSLLISQLPALAQSIEGRWYGKAQLDTMEHHYLLDFRSTDDGMYGYLDLPSSGQFRLRFDSLSLEEGQLVLRHRGLQLDFEGDYLATTQQLSGQLKIGEQRSSITFFRTPQLERTQVIERPLPYTEQEVIFHNEEGTQFAGTLTHPSTEGPFPGLVLVSGSGPQNRDEEILGHRPFAILADYLSRRGVAVLRYDDRGYGASEGQFRPATTQDYANDAWAATQFLANNPFVEIDQLGIAGHSEGGNIAPIVAQRDSQVDYLILLAAPGMSNYESYLYSLDLILQDYPETYERDYAFFQQVYETMASIEDKDALRDSLQQQFSQLAAEMEEEELRWYGGAEGYVASNVAQHSTEWYHYYLQFDVTPYLEQLQLPVLALNGDQDKSVTAKENLAGIEARLTKAGNPHFVIRELQGVNHFFQESETASIQEVYFNEVTFSEEALRLISQFIADLP